MNDSEASLSTLIKQLPELKALRPEVLKVPLFKDMGKLLKMCVLIKCINAHTDRETFQQVSAENLSNSYCEDLERGFLRTLYRKLYRNSAQIHPSGDGPGEYPGPKYGFSGRDLTLFRK